MVVPTPINDVMITSLHCRAMVNTKNLHTKTSKENDELKDLIDENDDNASPTDEDTENLAEDISLDISKDKSDEETS